MENLYRDQRDTVFKACTFKTIYLNNKHCQEIMGGGGGLGCHVRWGGLLVVANVDSGGGGGRFGSWLGLIWGHI